MKARTKPKRKPLSRAARLSGLQAERYLLRKLIKLAEMKVLRIEPEDVIVLQTDLCLDKDQVQALRDRAAEQFGASVLANNRIVILTAGLKTGVLRKRKLTVRQR